MNNIISNINTTFIRFNAPISRAKIPTLSVYFLRIFPSTFPWLASPVFDVFYTITQVTPENFRQIISSTSVVVRPFFSALINAGRHAQKTLDKPRRISHQLVNHSHMDASKVSDRVSSATLSLPDRQCIFSAADHKSMAGSPAWKGSQVCNWPLRCALLRYPQRANDHFQSQTGGPACAAALRGRYAARCATR